ncbi:MAG: hypothetical protein MUD12_06290 [Spirochaetes bacterium]|jgi:hypothetical protein|nr:hypothetical protein [Spirochaetota bacterium]
MYNRIIPFLFILLMPAASYPDSPVTSTDFHKAYLDNPVVKKAKDSGIMDRSFAEFLSDPKKPVDLKAAVINALSWNIDGKGNAPLFLKYVSEKKGKRIIANPGLMLPDEIFCYGYLLVMDDYFHPKKGIVFLEKARQRNRSSFTVNVVLAIAKAQLAMDSNWCQAWESVNRVYEDRNLRQDMIEPAKIIIMDYMKLYQPECRKGD